MMELMSMEALRLGADRRREVLEQTKRDAKLADGMRHAAGVALMGLGQRIAGEIPASQPLLRPAGDCA